MGFSENNRGNEDILVLKVSHFLTLAQGHLHMKIKLAFLINHWAIFNQILNEACLYKLMKFHQHNGCHMTKMAVMPIYGINTLKIFFPGGPILMKLCMKHQRPKLFIFCLNHDPGLIVTYFTARSNFAI